MSWKADGGGSFTITGPLKTWIETFQKWHAADASELRGLDFSAYLLMLSSGIASKAKAKWSTEFFGTRKAKRLDAFLATGADGSVTIPVFDVLDYLAENIDRADLERWEHDCRQLVRSYAAKRRGVSP